MFKRQGAKYNCVEDAEDRVDAGEAQSESEDKKSSESPAGPKAAKRIANGRRNTHPS